MRSDKMGKLKAFFILKLIRNSSAQDVALATKSVK